MNLLTFSVKNKDYGRVFVFVKAPNSLEYRVPESQCPKGFLRLQETDFHSVPGLHREGLCREGNIAIRVGPGGSLNDASEITQSGSCPWGRSLSH